MNNRLQIAYVTINNAEQAKKLAQHLLQKKLVACVNIFSSVQSMYYWQGQLACDDEVVMVMKTLPNKYDQLEQEIKSHHPYDVPCIIKIDGQANQSFLDFVTNAVK